MATTSRSRRPLAVVTGATGGIGGALAPMLARRGWDVVAPIRDAARGDVLRRRLAEEAPEAALAVYEADLADRRAVAELGAVIRRDHPQVDALFNVAGYLSAALRASLHGDDLHLELNVIAPLLLTHSLAPALAAAAAAHGRAVVVNTSSNAIRMSGALDVARLAANPKQGIFGAYGQSKLALTAATRRLADVYSAAGVALFAVDPGGNQSAMTKGSGAPFFVRWMSSLLPKPSVGAAKLMAPLDAGFAARPGDLIAGGKARRQPAQVGASDVVDALMRLLDERVGAPLDAPSFAAPSP